MSEEQTGRRADRSGGGGRRGTAQRRRVDAVVVLAMVLPTVVAVSLAVLDGDEPEPWEGAAPSPARLTRTTVVCPTPVNEGGQGDVVVSRVPVPGVGGEVGVRTTEDDPERLAETDPVAAEPDAVGRVPAGAGAVVLSGEDDAAAGLVAGRSTGIAAAPECRAPSYDEWFVGLGASAEDASSFELVNPDPGPAIVEIALVGPHGDIEEPALRGIRVPGHGVRVLDLAEIARRVPLAAHLTVTRGRVAATVRQTRDPLGSGRPLVDYLPEQDGPSTTNLLLGVPLTGDDRELYLANPGDDEARANVRVVTEEAVFSPAGVEAVEVPPHTVRRVSLADVLTGKAAEGALGLSIESSAPLVAGVQAVEGDLGRVAPVVPVDEPTVTLVPAGPKRLLVGAALRPGTVRVTAVAADGEVLVEEERVEIDADRAVPVDLPDAAVAITVTARNTPVAGTVLLTGPDDEPVLAQVRLRPAQVYAEVPAVHPG